MSASLVEMVMAIALSGIILTAAIVPTVESMNAYHEAELDLAGQTRHATAAVRVEQTIANVWRSDDPPGSGGPLEDAAQRELEVGSWEIRFRSNRIEQRYGNGSWLALTDDVENFGFQYLMRTGSWQTSAGAGELDDVLAVRFSWASRASGAPTSGLLTALDACFSGGSISLPAAGGGGTYRRSDYERDVAFTIGNWPS